MESLVFYERKKQSVDGLGMINCSTLIECIVGDKYNLDHKFFPSANKADKIAAGTFFEYFKYNHNPFDFCNEVSLF